jgi:hypothetical protein
MPLTQAVYLSLLTLPIPAGARISLEEITLLTLTLPSPARRVLILALFKDNPIRVVPPIYQAPFFVFGEWVEDGQGEKSSE